MFYALQQHENLEIAVTDIYLTDEEQIYIDGIDTETDTKETEYYLPSNYYEFALFFFDCVLNCVEKVDKRDEVCAIKDELAGLCTELAEKELVDTLDLLPEQMTVDGEYTEEIQEKFNSLYDKYEEKLFDLVGFDYHFLFNKFTP